MEFECENIFETTEKEKFLGFCITFESTSIVGHGECRKTYCSYQAPEKNLLMTKQNLCQLGVSTGREDSW